MGCSFGAPIRNVNLLTYRADIGVAIANVGGLARKYDLGRQIILDALAGL